MFFIMAVLSQFWVLRIYLFANQMLADCFMKWIVQRRNCHTSPFPQLQPRTDSSLTALTNTDHLLGNMNKLIRIRIKGSLDTTWLNLSVKVGLLLITNQNLKLNQGAHIKFWAPTRAATVQPLWENYPLPDHPSVNPFSGSNWNSPFLATSVHASFFHCTHPRNLWLCLLYTLLSVTWRQW